ncbi:filamentous haemagglutinin family protein [Prosthecobacter sp.]|uniref:filamentous haemagglutinin family protein n=1 Tax=Prosthecobacter sp. TaxID=1965333 RepID=UPI003783178D
MPRISSRPRRLVFGEFSFGYRVLAVITAFTLLPGPLPVALAVDVLRHGFGAPAGTAQPQTDAGASGATGAEAAAVARVHASDILARNTQAVLAVQAMQDAARSLAISGANNVGVNPNGGGTLPNVPDGLGAGALQIIGTPDGASAPTQSVTGGHTTVNIVQNQQQAFIDWQTFNIGKNTTLNFDQSAGGANVGQWIAFNRVTDPTGNPTQILGSITAPGQVYVINQNGIIFGGSSQVDVHTMVATSLPINDDLVDRGLLNPLDVQYLFSALDQPAGAKGSPAFTAPTPLTASGQTGDVTVQAGAKLSSPTTADHVGGRIALIGANVTNNGKISTPDGQTILAAGLQVGFAAHSSSDPSLRGLDVYLGAVGSYAGTAVNNGIIDVPRGNVTMTGMDVRQDGAITSSTSVALNGSITLNASYNAVPNAVYDPISLPDVPPFFYQSSGALSLGSGSVTQILPEWASTETIVGTQLALVSQINMTAQSVYLGANASVLAPNAQVSVNAGIWDFVDSPVLPRSTFVYSGGQIYVDAGATISVAGSTDVSVPVSQYLLTVQLRSNELADSPLQRNGALRNQTVTVDLRETGTYNGKVWYGTPLADLSGYVGIIQRTVAELTTAGGSIKLSAGGSVVVQSSATLDVSGGWVDYQGSTVQTTQLISDGQIINIAEATPDKVYSGIYTGSTTTTQTAWSSSSTSTSQFGQSTYQDPGGIQGAAAGKITLSTPALALDGSLFGTTVAGSRQRDALPQAATLTISLQAQANSAATSYPLVYPVGTTVFLRSGVTQPVADPFASDPSGAYALRSDRVATINLSPELVSTFGFGHFVVQNVDGRIVLPAASVLTTAPLGSVTLAAAGIDLDGTIITRGGSISLTAYDFSPAAVVDMHINPPLTLPAADLTRGDVRIGSTAVLNTTGLIVDERGSVGLNLPRVITGGSISINAMTVTLATNGLLDVSGGVRVASTSALTYGDAGSISIKTGQDIGLTGVLGGGLTPGSILRGFSGATGGTLSLQAPAFQIGGTSTDPNTLVLDPEFFSAGGFNSFALTGIGQTTAVSGVFSPAVYFAPGTSLSPVVQSWVAVLNSQNSGVTLTPQILAEGVRKPVSLDFEAHAVRDDFSGNLLVRGEIVMAAGSRIQTDARGSVTFNADAMALAGSVIAPGGSITVKGGSQYVSFDPVPTSAFFTVDLMPGSMLSTAGERLLLPNAFGLNQGSVLAGGTISISGNVLAESGAVLDASGASGMLDLTLAQAGQVTGASYASPSSGLTTPLFNGTLTVPVRVDSNGGSITFKGSEMLFVDATLSARSGGVTATGGALALSSGRFYQVGVSAIPEDVTMLVTQSTPSVPVPVYTAGGNALGRFATTAGGATIAQQGYFQASTFQSGGFDSLTLSGTVQFSGPVTLTAASSLRIASSGVFSSDDVVNLNAAYVSLGQDFRTPMQSGQIEALPYTSAGQPYYIAPTSGTGSLNVAAKTIDIGILTLQNTGSASFNASNGDIRGDGTFDIAGNLTMTAGQIYTPTASIFTMASYGGSITFASGGVRSLPLSAGGTINVYATTINQGGTLVAPAGTINLGWDGTGASPQDLLTGAGIVAGRSVPVASNLSFLAGSRTSVSQIDPITGLGVSIPYGYSSDGSSWIDPLGQDITGGGLPTKAVNTSATSITAQTGATIDLRGGGDLYAYRWVSGTGGTVDILANSGAFAVLPGYTPDYAPFGQFNNTTNTVNLASGVDGYKNTTLSVGDRVYLNGGSGLQAGYYTLLPARYALLAGAFLVTPQSGAPQGSVLQPSGASLVSGYRFNDLNSSRQQPLLYTSFEVAPSAVTRVRAQYDDFSANTFLRDRAIALNITVPRLPLDAGRLLLEAVNSMTFLGQIQGSAGTGGRGASVDISSPSDILIATAGTSAAPGVLVLDAAQLSAFAAESLLIGGQRSSTTAGTALSVRTSNITVGNSAASALTMPEVILAASSALTLNAGAVIAQSGAMVSKADTLLIGSSAASGSGNGALLRVSSDSTASMLRSGVVASTAGPVLSISAGASITGSSITLDSTSALSVDTAAVLSGQTLNIDSGRISVQLDSPGSLQPSPGFVIAGSLLASLQGAKSLSLLSYSSIDLYGTGQLGSASMTSLALHAGEIRGFNNNSGTVTLTAQSMLLDNSASATAPGAVASSGGTLALNTTTLRLGANTLQIDQFTAVTATATNGILAQGSGALQVQGTFTATTPVIAGDAFASQAITSSGAMVLQSSAASATPVVSGLGATLALTGSSISAGTEIDALSGQLTLTATTGNLDITGTLKVSGTAQTFYDQVKYTDAGRIDLKAALGSINLQPGGVINIAADASLLGGNAGTLAVSTPAGTFSISAAVPGSPLPQGQLVSFAGAGGHTGSFILTAGALPSLASLNATLNAANISYSRSIRVLSGDVTVDGTATSSIFNLSADQGSITVTGLIDASGATGGQVTLQATGSVILASGSRITAAAQKFDNAGKGGNISLMAGSERNGVASTSAVLDLQTGSQIDLSVAGNIPGSTLTNVSAGVSTNVPANLGGFDTITSTVSGTVTLANGGTISLVANKATSIIGAKSFTLNSTGSVSFAGSSAWGLYTGTLQLRAPQVAASNNLQMNPINAQITGASVITAEGYKIYTPASGTLNAAALTAITTNGSTFAANTTAITNTLFAGNANAAALKSIFFLLPGAEVINTSGDLTLGLTNVSPTSGDWNLGASTARFGTLKVPGILTLRASGNLIFFNSLSDGFATGLYNSALSTLNTALPTNLQSWSYRLTAGADFTAADYHQVQSAPATGSGSLLLGRNAAVPISSGTGTSTAATTISVVNPSASSTTNRFQVIRTGTGEIDISTARDVKFLNVFSGIYTVGAQVADPTLGGTFAVPVPDMSGYSGPLGTNQESPKYPAQYTMAGGNVTIAAQNDVIQQTRTTTALTGLTDATLIPDSSRQMPTNWLFRRGAVDPTTGVFASSKYNESASTTWWTDFSNFFMNVGALGGGNVTVSAGRDVSNVDAVIPTNARMQGRDSTGVNIAPDAANMIELGGGDLLIHSGRNLDGGVYYVERGKGTLDVGGSIITNKTRSPSLGIVAQPSGLTNPTYLNDQTWLPTTLFVGKSSFSIKARGNVLLGPVANAFLVPQGYSNSFWYKTYFSTYAADSSVNVSSLAGNVTWRASVTLPNTGFAGVAIPTLRAWYQDELLLSSSGGASGRQTASFYQPWLRLAETSLQPFNTAFSLMPGTLRVTAFAGGINIAGSMNLSPSAQGTLELLSANDIIGLNPTGTTNISGAPNTVVWSASRINLSDATPTAIPGITSPFAYQNQSFLSGPSDSSAGDTVNNFLSSLDNLFNETGSTTGTAAVLQTKQALHAAGLLHAADTSPVFIYSKSGSISGMTLYSPKATRIIGGLDIADVSFYLQNNSSNDLSIVSAGRDIIAYDNITSQRVLSRSTGNLLGQREVAQAGDIQISGPGTLQVLAGRNLDLGVGSNNSDGTGVGITSIGNGRNPYLPFVGSDIYAAAGIGRAAVGINGSSADFASFLATFGTGALGARYLAELADSLGVPSVDLNNPALSAEQRDRLALALFYLVLRDAGRDYNNPDSPNFRSYDNGFQAIAKLFPTSAPGSILTQARDIRTKSGGDITLFATGGALTLSPTAIGQQLAPPGIITESGGGISVFTHNSVDIGISRIFTLKGGDITIWSSTGDIAAGSSAKTVQSAPPTRVIIDPQSANVNLDLAGLATGGGIGALATVGASKPSNIDLIAPVGAVDAGDAGIRATGNLNIAATVVLNASNIQVSGSSAGTPSAPAVASPNIGGLSSAASSGAATNTAATQQQQQQQQQQQTQNDTPSIITVEVLGYGGGGGDDEKRKSSQPGE